MRNMRIHIALLGIIFATGVLLMASAATSGGAAADSGKPAVSKAIFAGGCFWCMEKPFEALDGVLGVTSGYTGGHKDQPTYQEVSSGGTGHAEAVLVEYDPARVDYQALLDVFWRNVNPLDAGGQFCDRGDQYRSAIFVLDERQDRLAHASRDALDASGRLNGPVATEIVPASTFWPAEDYHQDYYKNNPIRYKFYRYNCGRDAVLERLWGK